MFDYLVIGKGLIGSAAARYLAQAAQQTGCKTAVLGPDEPTDWPNHRGVFGSYYDQGRITWRLNPDAAWSELAQRSIAQYRAIEAASGVRFYQPVGMLNVGHAEDAHYLPPVVETAARLNAPYDWLTSAAIRARFPGLHFPETCAAVFEPDPAGYINPRELVRAQLVVAAQQGATIIRETAVGLSKITGGWNVKLLSGDSVQARKLLLTTGAFTNAYPLTDLPLALRVKTETVVMARLTPGEAARLSDMPAVLYDVAHPDIRDIYMLPPIAYPDGHVYLKLGSNASTDRMVTALDEMREWYISGESDAALAMLRDALLAIVPGLQADDYHTHRCLISYTPHRKPMVDQVDDGLFTAVGGNGVSAKASDALGKLAADLTMHGSWQDSLDAALFRHVPAETAVWHERKRAYG